MKAVSSPAGKPDARDCTGLCSSNFLEGLAEIMGCGAVRKHPKRAAVDPACSQAHDTDSGKAIAEEGDRLGAPHQIHLETRTLEPSSSVRVQRMSSTSAATDFDSASSPARRTSSRPKREHTHKLGGDGSDKGYGSSGDEVEQGEKRRRFVWTAELHQRFEEAVRQLGLASAKPQAIWQLMDCGSESDAPTRKNVKSHWQKYRVAHGCPTVHATSANSLPGPHLAPCFAGRVVLLPLNSPSHAAI